MCSNNLSAMNLIVVYPGMVESKSLKNYSTLNIKDERAQERTLVIL